MKHKASWYQKTDKESTSSLLPQQATKRSSLRLTKALEEVQRLKFQKNVEEKKRNRIKIALEMHQQMYTELEAAAITIQKYAKGYIARKKYKEELIKKYEYENYLLKVEKEIGEFWVADKGLKHMAAYKIQRYWKGFRKVPQKVGLLKRLAKRLFARKMFKEMEQRRKKILKGAESIGKIMKKITRIVIDEYWTEWRENIEIEESEESNNETVNEEQDFVEELEEIPEKEEIDKNDPKIEIQKPETGLFLPLALLKPKMFILGDANFIKPTLSSKYKRGESPDSQLPRSKLSKAQTLRNKKLIKKVTQRLAGSNNKPPELRKKYDSQQIRQITEVQINKSTVMNKYQYVKSRISQYKKDSAIRSSSLLAPVRKESVDSEERQKENSEVATLGFKQALPDLYHFVESYGNLAKKNRVVQSTAGLVINNIKT
jgi:hypothetical protein